MAPHNCKISMIFKTFITDINTLGVAIDRLGVVTKANVSSSVIDYTLYGKALEGLSAKQVALALSTESLSPVQIEEIVRVNKLIEKYGAEELVKVGLLSTNSALLASEKTLSAQKLIDIMVEGGCGRGKNQKLLYQNMQQ